MTNGAMTSDGVLDRTGAGEPRMVGLFRLQARACGELGSPFYGRLINLVADDIAADGPAAAVLAGHADDPAGSALALRLMGTAHGIALSGDAPELAAHYPSCGGDGAVDAAWPALRRLFQEQPERLRRGLDSAPQTNEVGRAAALIGGLLHIVGPDPMPLRLWEIGASAGLNLRADRFRFIAADGPVWGVMSPVELEPAWNVRPPDAPGGLQVIERVGGDLNPLDPSVEADAIRLTSYIWPDQTARLGRLRGAMEIAMAYPARMVRSGAADLVDTLELQAGALTVLWHSVMWQYLSDDERSRVSARIEALGAQASAEQPFAHLWFEPSGPGGDYPFLVTVRTWPGGRERVLGQGPPHGLPLTWS